MKGYLATHFFNEAGFDYTKKLAEEIRKKTGLDLYVPQENSGINDKSAEGASEVSDIDIALADCEHLEQSQILIASLDGVEIDSGVSAEIGWLSGYMRAEEKFCASPKPRMIIGVYTDMRRDGEGDNRFYINLFTKGLVNLHGTVVNNTESLVEAINIFAENVKYLNQFEEE